jgi:hypothetical protein
MGKRFMNYIYVSYFAELCLFFNHVIINHVNRSISFILAFEMKDTTDKIVRNELSQGYFHHRYQYFYFRLECNIHVFNIFEKACIPYI